nr:TetR/AcrR family transcriptional regulator [Gordonia sp. LAM0048]
MGNVESAGEMSISPRGPRRRRANAERNRQALLDAAREALAYGDGEMSLEAVARRAGVGIGTLYRHFPTRDRLVIAAYDAEVDTLVAQAGPLLEQAAPRQALREWMNQFARFAMTKRGMLDALRTGALEAAAEDHTGLHERMAAAIAPHPAGWRSRRHCARRRTPRRPHTSRRWRTNAHADRHRTDRPTA